MHPQMINTHSVTNLIARLMIYLARKTEQFSPLKNIPESQTVAISPVVSLAETAVTGLLCPARLWT